jgi:dihydroflavonol-4-reductase
MRALVTGSTGLLGNNLVRTLIDAGHEVWALARSKEKAQRELSDTAARVVLGDIRNVANFAYELRGITLIDPEEPRSGSCARSCISARQVI